MKIKKPKGYKGKCDDLFGKIVRSAGECLRCRATESLQTSHIVSRRYSATRCDLRNAQCLCAKCHMYFTAWPKEFGRWITDTIGIELYEELKLKAETVTKVDWEEIYKTLQQEAKDI